MTTTAEIARAARAVLRKAFPGSKISVTSSSGITVRWTDDGPEIEQVQDVLLATGCAEARTGWDKKRYLQSPGGNYGESYWLDRYNVAQHAAEQEEFEQRRQEYAAENQRVNEMIARECAAKRRAVPVLAQQQLPPVDPAVFAAFETLRQRAETEVQISEDAARRPSWAPPLLLGEELAELCLELRYITEDNKLIARLWAGFASPKRSGKWLRQHVSILPLEGLYCRGFSLWAGASRGSQSDLLFEAQREQSGTWRFGPQEYLHAYCSMRGREWEHLIRRREQLRHEPEQYREQLSEERQRQVEAGIAECSRRLEAIDADDLVKAKAHRDRQRMRQRVLELARARVLEFTDVQMQTAARLWGHCCVCGKALTDPVSLERGIGPDCYAHKINFIRQSAREGWKLENIAVVVGMPLEFVNTVVHEEAVS